MNQRAQALGATLNHAAPASLLGPLTAPTAARSSYTP